MSDDHNKAISRKRRAPKAKEDKPNLSSLRSKMMHSSSGRVATWRLDESNGRDGDSDDESLWGRSSSEGSSDMSLPRSKMMHSSSGRKWLTEPDEVPAASRQKLRICDICDDFITGIYYHCSTCVIDICSDCELNNDHLIAKEKIPLHNPLHVTIKHR
jgi:hypothetical protein